MFDQFWSWARPEEQLFFEMVLPSTIPSRLSRGSFVARTGEPKTMTSYPEYSYQRYSKFRLI